jgi:integrase
MLREGVPIEKVSKLCRHKNIQTTLEYYAEIEMEDLRDSINVLDPLPKTPKKEPEPGNIIKFKVG